MSPAPRVSVLLPVWNAARTLPECLASLLGQSLTDHEVVAVDDGSTDGSREWLLARARAEPRLRVLPQPHRGLVASLNRAAAAARAPFLARMDADDVSHRERLGLQLARLLELQPEATILGARVRVPGRGAANRGMRAYARWSNRLLSHALIVRDMFVESPLVHPSVMFSRALLRRLGGYREGAFPEDYDLWLRALAAGARFAKRPEVLLEWRDLPGRLTRRDPRYAEACFRERKLDALVQGGRLRRGAVVWGAGPTGKRWGRALLSRHVPLAAFVEVAPRKLGQRIHGAPVLGIEAGARLAAAFHLLAVAQPGARTRLRGLLRRAGLREGRDFVAVA